MRKTSSTVYVIEDEAEIRQMLDTLMRSVSLEAVCFSNPQDFLDNLSADASGCIISDVRMPGFTGLQLQEALIQRRCAIPLILVTAFADVDMAVRAMRKGAFDFMEKPFCQQRLLDSVLEALSKDGKRHREQGDKQVILDRVAQLTRREREVLQSIIEGSPNKVIAYDLGIAQSTVENHRARVMTKMGAESLADLVGMAYFTGLISSQPPMPRPIIEA